MKKTIMVAAALAVMLGAVACKKDANNNGKEEGIMGSKATIETDMGNFTIEFYPKEAPGTVKNFITLANKGYYDGLVFHRVVPGFVIQGGDPAGNGMGGPGYSIAAEFNSHKHVEGTVAMARKGNDINSAGSQWYVSLKPLPSLDGQYTVFGQVTSGMDVVKKIAAVPTDGRDMPISPVHMKKVTIQE